MGTCDIQLLVNTICYFAIFVCGFAVSIPLGIITIKNNHNCILYLSIDKKGTRNIWNYSKDANCNFPVYTSVVVCILYGLVQGVYHVIMTRKALSNPFQGAEMWVRPYIVSNFVGTALMFIASCLVSVGFARTCQSITNYYTGYKCSYFQNLKITDPDTGKDWNTGNFYKMVTVTQIAAWICFLLWLTLALSGIIRFIRNRRLAASLTTLASRSVNSGNEPKES